GTWNVPTLSLVEHLASDTPAEEMIAWPEMRYMPQQVREGWVRSKHQFQAREDFQPEAAQALVELRQELTRALHAAGAPIALGSDAPQFFNVPGFSIHHELRMMVATGLTPYEVLATGTREPARYFGTPDAFGTIEPGRRADLILLEANPLDDVANVQRRAGVMVRGQWLPEEQIQARLDAIAEAVAE
ncbi:MAG: amidohydrolase family protein, partial [Luteimonas sp.]